MATTNCPSCGKTLNGEAPMGLCAECLMKSAFNTGTAPDTGRVGRFVPPAVDMLRPLFPQLEKFGPEVSHKIAAYRTSLDPRLGVIYRERKDYEESVMMINDVISSYIERQEERAHQSSIQRRSSTASLVLMYAGW